MALTTEQESKMWAMLNETRGQIGYTAYKDYIFGILFLIWYNVYQNANYLYLVSW